MKGGPASRLADFAKECKEKKLRAFSTYKTKADMEKVLQEDYKISSGDITLIPQFKPVTCPVDENSPEFKLCIDDILRRIKNMGPVVDSNEAMRCEYISTILHTAVSILGDLVITPQTNINMNKKKRKVDEAFDPDYDYVYGIVSTGTDWYFILHSTEGIYSTSRTEYRI